MHRLLYDTTEAAALLCISRNNVLALIHTHRLPAKRMLVTGDKRWRFYVTADALEKFVAELPDAKSTPMDAPTPKRRKRMTLEEELRTVKEYV